MRLLVWAYRRSGNPTARADATAFSQTCTAEEWRDMLAAQGLNAAQVTPIRRPGQPIYPCVILAGGEKPVSLETIS